MIRKMTGIIETCSVIALVVLFTTNAFPQTTWTKYENNPVLDLGATGEWDDTAVAELTVLFQDSGYKMWYAGCDGSNFRIGYATSPDGITWTKYENNPVLDLGASGEWDDTHLFDPFVLFKDGEYRMWYGGHDGSTYRIGYATSPDGITWTKYENNPVLVPGEFDDWDNQAVDDPFVLFKDGEYRMWYGGQDSSNNTCIGYAISPDGITWTKYENNPVLVPGEFGDWDNQAVDDSCVLFEEDVYKMWYSGKNGSNFRIGYATSPDGITWTKYENNPVLDLGASGEWDDTHLFDPFVLFKDGEYRMWYIGHDGSNYRIGYATALLDLNIVTIDIKPRSCPNPINVKSHGVLPVAILGTEDFDVATVDVASVRLAGVVAPCRSAMRDVATPYEPFIGKESKFDCTVEGPDGFLDLILKFKTQEVIEAIEDALGQKVEDGEVLIVTLTGNLLEEYGGTSILGEDVVVIKKKEKKCGMKWRKKWWKRWGMKWRKNCKKK